MHAREKTSLVGVGSELPVECWLLQLLGSLVPSAESLSSGAELPAGMPARLWANAGVFIARCRARTTRRWRNELATLPINHAGRGLVFAECHANARAPSIVN